MFASLLPLVFSEEIFPERYKNTGMRTDIIETGTGRKYIIDLAGFSKDDLRISLSNGYMQVVAEKKDSSNNEEGKYIQKERSSMKSMRTFSVGSNITEDDINASFKDGVLTIDVTKKEKEKKIINIS